MRITKLDRRHNGNQAFTHYVNPAIRFPDNMSKLHEWRVWCWENFGPGAERDVAIRLAIANQPLKWAWDTEHGNCRLYLNETELTFFKLKWG
jgi:hypothetical protein